MSEQRKKSYVLLRSLALVSLVLQNAGVILATKYSFRQDAKPYSQSAAILVSEILKLVTCLCVEFHVVDLDLQRLLRSLEFSTSNVYMIFPSTLYVLQNIAQLRAINGLTPALYVTGVQLKVLTSAFFSAAILRRQLSTRQIISFFPLMAGVALVQLDQAGGPLTQFNFSALSYLLVAVTLSGLAGVLLESAFKREGESIWVKNVYLSLFSLPSAMYATKVEAEEGGGHLNASTISSGFDVFVFSVVILLALGGLLTALVMKHAGTLTKCFAVSVSIVICSCVSVISGYQIVTPQVLLGATLVIISVFLYASNAQ